MIDYKIELKKAITISSLTQLNDYLRSISISLDEKNFAGFFTDSIYLNSILHFIIDKHWIQSQKSQSEIQFHRFIKPFLESELKSLLFLHSFFSTAEIDDLRVATKALSHIENLFIQLIKERSAAAQKKILQICLQQMSEMYEFEHQIKMNLKTDSDQTAFSLYRSFDALDQIFGLNYILNETSSIDQKERLYEGAGVGVQSSYATTLLALRYLNLPKASSFVDLGSGYGRIGLVMGLMRPDIQFTGYEFVKERAEIANKATIRLNLDEHVRFVAQDLSSPDFRIPAAETYYIYDAFTDETYAIIMNQLEEISLHKKITVVTKGNAKFWLKSKFWSEPQEFNSGSLCFFRSKSGVRPD